MVPPENPFKDGEPGHWGSSAPIRLLPGTTGMIAAGWNVCTMGRLPMLIHLDDLPACAGCGVCCHQVVDLVQGIDNVPEELVVEREGIRSMDQRGNGACVALHPVSRLCTIYERRPQTCRDFKRAEALCRIAVARDALRPLRDRGPAT